MALINQKMCSLCEEVTTHENMTCLSCIERDKNQARLKKEEHWNSLDTEQKLDYLFKRTL